MKDAIIVLAGGVDEGGALPIVPRIRMDKGIELFKNNIAPKLILSGAYGFWLDYFSKIPEKKEAFAMKEYALAHGVPNEAILIEEESKDTLGNAYFTKIQYLEKNDWKSVVVVTSDFHIERTKLVFDLVLGPSYSIEYVSTKTGLSKEEREKKVIQEKKTIPIMLEFWQGINRGDTEEIGKMIYKKHPGYAENSEYSYEDLLKLLGRD